MTRVFVPQSSFGQMLGTSFLMISQSRRLCSFSVTSVDLVTSWEDDSWSLSWGPGPSGAECCCVAFAAASERVCSRSLSICERSWAIGGALGGAAASTAGAERFE